jgi:hypothetical protein
MLPQYFEPFSLHDNRQLGIAFKKGKLPYLEDKGIYSFIVLFFFKYFYFLELYNDLTSCWLDSIALATKRLCVEQTLQITKLTPTGLKQLTMDLSQLTYPEMKFSLIKIFYSLDYLKGVLDDFGLKDVVDLQDMIELLEVKKTHFEELARTKQLQMVTAIRTMRGL